MDDELKEIHVYECGRCGCRVELGETFDKKYQHIYSLQLFDSRIQVCDPCLSAIRYFVDRFINTPDVESPRYKKMIAHETDHELKLKNLSVPESIPSS